METPRTDRIGPFISRLLIAAFALSLLVALFILSPWWSLSPWSGLLKETSDRINLAQLVIETAGFSLALTAGIFAASEFRRSQLRPSLHLLLHDRERDRIRDSLVTTKDRNKLVPFDIYIHNTGHAAARFVKVRILFIGKPLFAKPSTRMGSLRSPNLLSCPLGEYWNWKDTDKGRHFVFDGKDEYVCHPGSLEILGSFELSIEVEHQYSGSYGAAPYWISADGMSTQSRAFLFTVIEPRE